MDFFQTKKGVTYCEDVPLSAIAAKVGTPVYVYSLKTIQRHCQNFLSAFGEHPTQVCFAVKANSNIAILRAMAEAGLGADIVSQGELERALLAGIEPSKIVFSGVGKSSKEIARGLEVGIFAFNVESEFELESIHVISKRLRKPARICLRVNPNVDAKTNKKIATGLHVTKFGLTESQCHSLLKRYGQRKNLKFLGLACHIGSQITSMAPLRLAAKRVMKFSEEVQKKYGLTFQVVNLGGGLGIRYKQESPPSLEDYAQTLLKEVKGSRLTLVVEPGRVLAGNTGILLTRVIGTKTNPQSKRNFAVVDASMTELIRPTLYGAYHDILTVKQSKRSTKTYDVVGPVCETSDILGEKRRLPTLQTDDLLYIRTVGAYGASMASNYNSRVKPAEVLVDGSSFTVIRKKEKLADLWRDEVF